MRIRRWPTTATVGDQIDIYVQLGNATYELLVKTGAGQTCAFGNTTVAAATEITRIFITRERLTFRYHATNIWECILDARVPQKCVMRLSTNAAASEAASITWTIPTSISGAWTADVNVGSVASTSNGRMIVRRAGNFNLAASAVPANSIASGTRFGVALAKNDASTTFLMMATPSESVSNFTSATVTAEAVALAANDFLSYNFGSDPGSKGLLAFTSPTLRTHFSLVEVL
jgi:hypothetical protein